MPRKKSSIAKLTKTVATRKRRKPAKKNAALVHNPPLKEDLATQILPGIASYMTARIAGRIAYRIAKTRAPKAARAVGALTPAAVAIAGWIATHKLATKEGSKLAFLDKYHAGVIIGSSIAAIQSLAQVILPLHYSWILNDYHLDDVLPANRKKKQAQMAAAQAESPEAAGSFAEASAYHLPSKEFVEYSEEELSGLGFGVGQDDMALEMLEAELG